MIEFADREYVLTGRMLYGTRKDCERRIVERGGRVHDNVRRKTNYLVIGPIASVAWLESTHGRKILSAQWSSNATAVRSGSSAKNHGLHAVATRVTAPRRLEVDLNSESSARRQ